MYMKHLVYTLLFYIMIPYALFAVELPEQSYFDEVNMTIVPEYPKPNEQFTATIQSYAHNIPGNNIQWYIGDVLLTQGQGLNTLTLKAPIAGESLQITAKIGTIATAQRTIQPTVVDIVWEADTYTPTQYQGRALPVDSSNIIAQAIPHIPNKDTTTLIYNWYKNDTFLAQHSGPEKDTIRIPSPGLFEEYILSVTITNTQGYTLGQTGVKIKTTEPEIVFYPKIPLTGITFSQALTKENMNIPNIEPTLVAIPYFFSIQTPEEIIYSWNIHGAQALQEENQNSITLTNTTPQITITLTARNPQTLLQSTKQSITISKTPNEATQSFSNTQNQSYTSPFGDFNQ